MLEERGFLCCDMLLLAAHGLKYINILSAPGSGIIEHYSAITNGAFEKKFPKSAASITSGA